MERIKSWIKENRSNFYALLGYTILTLIMTYPLIFKITNYVPGAGGDEFSHLHYFWWWKHALIELGTNPYYIEYLYYPTGVSLAFDLAPFNAIVLIPLQLLFGLIISYNILVLFTFVVSGYGMYLLVKYLTNNKSAAFIAGCIFAFSPYHFAHALAHANLISIEWIPFCALFLIKAVKEPKKSNAIYAGIFLGLTSLSAWYYGIYIVLFTALLIFYYLWSDRKALLNISFIKRFSIMIMLFGLIVFPFVYPMLVESSSSIHMISPITRSVTYSADVIAFFIPSTFHPVFGEYVADIYANFTGNPCEYTVFIGYSVLILALYSVLKVKREKIKFWIISSLFFFILSLGPILHINGIFLIPNPGLNLDSLVQNIGLTSRATGIAANILQSGIPIPLPSIIMPFIPFVNMASVPSRLDVMVMLSLAVIAGYGCKELFIRISNYKKSSKIYNEKFVACLITAVILFEFLAIPYPLSNASVPPIYDEIFNDSEDYAILELPFVLSIAKLMYYQTHHEKKLVSGYVSRTPPYAIKFTNSTPFIKQLYNPYPYLVKEYGQNDILVSRSDLAYNVLNYYNIRYIMLHNDDDDYNYYRKLYPQLSIDFESTNNLLKTTLRTTPIYEDENLVIYNIRTIEHPTPFMMLDANWHKKEYWDNDTTSWVEDTILNKTILNKTSSFSFKYSPGNVKHILVQKTRPLHQYLKEGQIEKISYHNQPTRWMSNNGTIKIFSLEKTNISLNFTAVPHYKPTTLEIYLDGNLIGFATIDAAKQITIHEISIPSGESTMVFYVPEGCDKNRSFSIAFQDIEMKPIKNYSHSANKLQNVGLNLFKAL